MSKRKTRMIDTSNDEAKKARIDDSGREVLDNTPVTLPVRFLRGENIADRVRSLVEKELSRRAEHAGYETIDDANDFDVGDDYDPRSEHEVDEFAEAEYQRERDSANSGWFKKPKDSPAKGTPPSSGGVQQGGPTTKDRPKGTESSDE